MMLLLPRRLMRDFRSIVGIDMIDVCDGRHDRAVSGIIAVECIRDQPSWFTALAFAYAAKEAFGRFLVASPVHENINGIAVLGHGPPQIVPVPLDDHQDFVDMPGIP